MSLNMQEHDEIDVRAPAAGGRPWGASTWDRWAWTVPAAVTLMGFAYATATFPRGREDATLWSFLVKISLLVSAIVTAALFPTLRRGGVLLASAPFAIILGYIIPRLTYSFIKADFTLYYYTLWSLAYPTVIMAVTVAWKQAGGSSGRAAKAGLNGLILISSGFLEWMWFRVNTDMNYYDMKTIPHIDVILGHFPTYTGLFFFMLCHIPILVAVNMAPFDRWLSTWRGGRPVREILDKRDR